MTDENCAAKEILRSRSELLLCELSQRDIQKKSALIKETLFTSPEFQSASQILFYASIPGEVMTDLMIEAALRMHKTVSLPLITGKELQPKAIALPLYLPDKKFGIRQPPDGAPDVDPAELELVVLPAKLFDRQGHRVGSGQGYYDRFLKKAVAATRVGLAFSVQIVEDLPKQSHDVPVEIIFTELGPIFPDETSRRRPN